MTQQELARLIDQTNLNPGVPRNEVVKFCEEAAEYGFAAVCLLPVHVPVASVVLKGSRTRVCTVISFPLGADAPEVKLFEARDAIAKGALELDVVINVGAARAGDRVTVCRELSQIVSLAHAYGCLVKAIIELPLLTEAQAVETARWAEECGVDIVKTSTGFKGLKIRSTTVDDIILLRRVLRDTTGIKAAGGIRTAAEAIAMIEAGATRIGTSSGKQIIQGLQ